MKISVVCLCVFLFCTLYWAFDTPSLGLASAEDAVISTSISASIDSSDNATDSISITSDSFSESSEHNVIASEGNNLEPSADIQPIIEELSSNDEKDNSLKQQQEYAFIESVSQNAGVPHEVAGTSSGAVHTLVDSATVELKEKAEELSVAAAVASSTATIATAATPTAIPSHHNETPIEEKKEEEEKELPKDKSVLINSLDKVINDKEKNISVEVKIENGSVFSASNNTQQTDKPGIEVPSLEPKKDNNVTEQKGTAAAHEDIPSFSEWTQKQLEEAERKKEQVINTSAQSQQTNGKPSSGIKKRWKNYASPDCGAKIIAANPEAVSAGSVLSAHRDEYALNTCTSRIWFIVELCEAIQAKKIDLANFELFSSSPKDFSIFVSDRFPSRDWSSVGQFTGKDERDVQNFDLHPHLFGKYVKFEMHSHYGSEHYCPISLFRVYGTSEFEVLETENQVHANVAEDDDDDDETLDVDDGEAPKNLFSSAKDAVISIVKKAAEVLGNKGNASSTVKEQENNTVVKYTPLISTCTTPSHLVVCDNCSDLLFGNVFELLSCRSRLLVQLVKQPVIKNTLYNTDICSKFGFEFSSKSTSVIPSIFKSYVSSFFPPKYVAAMCNTVAVDECKVVLNTSNANASATLTSQDIDKMMSTKVPGPAIISTNDENTIQIEGASTPTVITEQPVVSSTDNSNDLKDSSYASQIKPTKTLATEEDLNLTDISASPVIPSGQEQTVHPTSSLNLQNDTSSSGVSGSSPDKAATPQMEHIEVSSEIVGEVETTTESSENLDLDALVTELNGESTLSAPAATVVQPSTPQGQKESVFLRLSNRIKALERNMSLSSQYLEELSRRYKKQVEEMQRLLDKTINTLTEENKRKDEHTQRLEEQITSLREAVESLIAEKNSWMHTTYWIFLSGIAFLCTLLFCRRNTESKQPRAEDRAKGAEVQRRKSIDVITHKTPVKKKRRPSEEALVVGGNYSHLMIDDADTNSQKTKDKKRKKKRQQLQRSNSITTLNEETSDNDDFACRTVNSDKGFYFAPKLTSSQIWKRQESAPPNLPVDWIDDAFRNRDIHDVPFALEESEHSTLEPISYPVLNQNYSNGQRRKENGNAITQSAMFTQTATDSRSKRLFHRQKGANGKVSRSGHKKSASFDESLRLKTPSPHGTDTTSLSNSFDDPNKNSEAPKKEKRGAFRKLFKNFTFK